MEFAAEVYQMSQSFLDEYPADKYPEILRKPDRPYACLLIDTHNDYYICVPFRSHIHHSNCYLLTKTKRSRKDRSGLDFSKIMIAAKNEQLCKKRNVDLDEYIAMRGSIRTIVYEAVSYVNGYVDHRTGKNMLSKQQFERKYRYSTLPYFEDILGIEEEKKPE